MQKTMLMDKLFPSFLTVPTMPLEFTLEDVPDEPNQLFASWMEPQPPNGVIISYSLTCILSSSQVSWRLSTCIYMYVHSYDAYYIVGLKLLEP